LDAYAAKHLTHSGDLNSFFKALEITTFPVIPDLPPSKKLSNYNKRMWENSVDEQHRRRVLLQDNLTTIYKVAWGKCSEGMQAKLKSHSNFEVEDLNANRQWLLKEIRGIMHQLEGSRFLFLSLNKAHCNLWNCKQCPDESLQSYLNTFKSKLDVLEHYGGSFGTDPGVISEASKLPRAPTNKEALLKVTKKQSVAILFITNADQGCYGVICAELENQYTQGTNQYPTDLTSAYNLLLNDVRAHNPKKNSLHHSKGAVMTPTDWSTQDKGESGVTFLQNSATPGKDGIMHAQVTCFKCNIKGHYANQCPKSQQRQSKKKWELEETQLMQLDIPTSKTFKDFTC
jgi:Zinc knuckle